MKKTHFAKLAIAFLLGLVLTFSFTACDDLNGRNENGSNQENEFIDDTPVEPAAYESLPAPKGEDPFAGKVFTYNDYKWTFGDEYTFASTNLDGDMSGFSYMSAIYKYTYDTEKKTFTFAEYKTYLPVDAKIVAKTSLLTLEYEEVLSLEYLIAQENGDQSVSEPTMPTTQETKIDAKLLNYEETINFEKELRAQWIAILNTYIERLTALKSKTNKEESLLLIDSKINYMQNEISNRKTYKNFSSSFMETSSYKYEETAEGKFSLSKESSSNGIYFQSITLTPYTEE